MSNVKPRPLGYMKKELGAYELILQTHNPGDVSILKSILDAEGITYYVQGEFVAPFVYYALPMRLMVKRDEAEKVREIIKDLELSYTFGGQNFIEDMEDDE